MEFRVKYDAAAIGPRVKKNMDRLGASVREAMRETAKNAAEEIHSQVADDITAAGRFGGEWVEAMKTEITETQRTITVNASYEPDGPPVSYWGVFQYGATISGNPLLTWPNTNGFAVGNTVPAFISKHSVTIPKKFHIIEIIQQVAKETAADLRARLRAR